MSEVASIPPSWITLAEVMTTILRRTRLNGDIIRPTLVQLVFPSREANFVSATMFPSLPGAYFPTRLGLGFHIGASHIIKCYHCLFVKFLSLNFSVRCLGEVVTLQSHRSLLCSINLTTKLR